MWTWILFWPTTYKTIFLFEWNAVQNEIGGQQARPVYSTCFQTCYCGELKQQQRRRQRERQKSDRFRLAKQQLCACITPFLYISLQSLHDCDVKLFNFTFLENVNTRQRLSCSFPELRLWSPLVSEKFATIWWIEQDTINTMKPEVVRIHFSSDVFVTVAVLVA